MKKADVVINAGAHDKIALERTMSKHEIDVVIHLAAQSIVKHASAVPAYTFSNNTTCALAVLDAARETDVDHVIMQSTDKVYGNGTGVTTESPFQATEPYASSKICTDVMAQCYAQTYGMKIAIVRPCNIYGYDWNNRIIPNTIKACLAGEKPWVYDNYNPLRQYVNVVDVVGAYSKIVATETTGPVNITGPDILGQKEVVELICAKFGMEPRLVDPPGMLEIQDQWMVPTPGYKMQTKLVDALDDMIEAYKLWG
jgi:nucleoside-diphosphate-sugar epimerase